MTTSGQNKSELSMNIQLNALQKISDQINDPDQKNVNKMNDEFQCWIDETAALLRRLCEDKSISSQFRFKSHYSPNQFSERESKAELRDAISRAQHFLKSIDWDTKLGEAGQGSQLSLQTVIYILKQILHHFNQHLQIMYHDPVQEKGTIHKNDLDRIRIGNEYDLQRILFSLIKPVFLTARREVPVDAGYDSMRYDILLDDYDLAIETKCSRPSMSERQLTEEIGADITKYPVEHLFFFIYDKDRIIRNKEVFERNFTKSHKEVGKEVETIVLQPVML